MGGNISAARTYLDRRQIASEKVALREAAQAKERERWRNPDELTDEELATLLVKNATTEELERILACLKDTEQKTNNGHIPNAN